MIDHSTEQVAYELLEAVRNAAEAINETLDISLQETTKMNGVNKVGISIDTGIESVRPTMYIDSEIDMIRSGKATVKECADSVLDRIHSVVAREDGEMASTVKDMLERADKSNITLQIVSKGKNEELLNSCPHRDIGGDLSIIARYKVNESGTAVIRNSMAANVLGMTSSEVIEAGIKNMGQEGYSVRSMTSILAEMMGVSEEELGMMHGMDSNAQMYVVTNESKVFGAAGIFADRSLREQVVEKLGEDFYIIPSSTHEVIVVAADQMPPEQMAAMINEVNSTQVAPEEVLSDHPYLVNAETLAISNPCNVMEDAKVAFEKQISSVHM